MKTETKVRARVVGKEVKVEWYDEKVYSSSDMNQRIRQCKNRILISASGMVQSYMTEEIGTRVGREMIAELEEICDKSFTQGKIIQEEI